VVRYRQGDGELGNRCRRRDAIPKTLFGQHWHIVP